MDPAAGRIAAANGVIAAVGVVFLILFYVLFFATPLTALGQVFGALNDICIGIQYLLTIPLALSLRRILQPNAPTLIAVGTVVGIASMVVVVVLQTALVIGAMTFPQEAPWVTLAMILGVGIWLVVTGVVARSTGRFPSSLRMSLIAVPYLFYAAWAFWLARQLRAPRSRDTSTPENDLPR